MELIPVVITWIKSDETAIAFINYKQGFLFHLTKSGGLYSGPDSLFNEHTLEHL